MRSRTLLLSLFLAFLSLGLKEDAAAKILRVGPGLPYGTIGAALDAASAGDTVLVIPGVFRERLAPHASVFIRGSLGLEPTILDGEGAHRIIEFTGADVTIERMELRNGYAATYGGGAAFFHAGSLTLRQCSLRNNVAAWSSAFNPGYGGAIYFYGENASLSCDQCLFADNHADGAYGAICFRIWDQPGTEKPTVSDEALDPTGLLHLVSCSFIGSQSRFFSGVGVSIGIAAEIRQCLFSAPAGNPEADFIDSNASPSDIGCNVYWGLGSPNLPKNADRTDDLSIVADPRACPGTLEALHESSPAYHMPTPCGFAGNLPLVCQGAMVLDASPRTLNPGGARVVRVVGYGLSETMGSALLGPGGARVPGTIVENQDTWFWISFDMTEAPPGSWRLSLQASPGDETFVDGFTVSPSQALGLLDGWARKPGAFDGVVFGRGLDKAAGLSLRHSESAEEVPLAIVERISPETLRVEADLSLAPPGIYDLVTSGDAGPPAVSPGALYLGPPDTLRVPEDAATIGEALAAAPPGATVLVAEGTYNESLLLSRPVRLIASGERRRTILGPGGTGQRIVRILPDGGALTEVAGFTIERGRVSSGPGGGILCEAPALIRSNRIRNNEASGPSARGGGVFASEGCRILDSAIEGNSAIGDGDRSDLWGLDPNHGGVGGGVFCLGCRVEGNSITNNHARIGAGFVIDGSLRNDFVRDNGADGDGFVPAGALRGEAIGNWFDNWCGGGYPYVLIEGPARVGWNRFDHFANPLCAGIDIVLLGSIDFYQNTVAGPWVGLRACLQQRIDRPTESRFRMWNNILDNGGALIVVGPPDYDCRHYSPVASTLPIPADRIWFGCNMGAVDIQVSPVAEPVRCDTCGFQGDARFCDYPRSEDGFYVGGWFDLRLDVGSQALPASSPAGCPDTLGAMKPGCALIPVLLLSRNASVDRGTVRLTWRLAQDVTVLGFDVEREAAGETKTLNAEPILPCGEECVFVDEDPPSADPITYYLRVLLPGESERYLLGSVSLASLTRAPLSLGNPRPQPARGEVSFGIGIPGAGGAVRLELFDPAGRLVRTIHDGPMKAGWQKITFALKDDRDRPLPPGTYFVRLAAGPRAKATKLVIVR